MRVKILLICVVLGAWLASGVMADDKQPDTYAYKRGVEAFNEEKYGEALEWFNRELSEHPDNGYAFMYISFLRYGSQEYGKALSAIENALKHLPKKDKEWRAISYAYRGDVYAVMGDTVKAVNDLSRAIQIDPSNSKFYSSKAQIHYEQGNYDLSDADYKKMTELDPGDVMGYMGMGRNHLAREQWNDAVDKFNYVARLAPDYSGGYSFRAEALMGLKKWDEATDDIIKALEIDGSDKAFFLMQTLPANVLDQFKSKLKIQTVKQPANSYWPYCLGIISTLQNNYDEAIAHYEKANSLDANSAFLENISRCLSSKRDYNKALEYVERAIAMNPEDYDLVDLKGDILSKLGRFEECIAERDKYIAKFPENPMAYIYRAEDFSNARQFKKAVEDYSSAFILHPDASLIPVLLMRRGDAYRFIGDKGNAVKDYEKLLETEKGSALTSSSWTPFAYSGLGNPEKAVETMQSILKNDTTDRNGALYNAACVYARIGDKAEAMRYLKIAIDKGYNDFSHIELDYDMDSLRDLPDFQELIAKHKKAPDSGTKESTKNPSPSAEKTESVEVPFTKEGGVIKVKCSINGLPLHFVFDTGAADVTMSMVEANFMLKNDYIKPSDIVGSARYMDANGDITEGTVVNLRKVNFGGLEIDNVRASVVRNQKAPLLLGQSVLGRLGKIEIDNPRTKLVITHKVNSK